MRVQKEFFPNPDCVEIHIDKVVTEEMILCFEGRRMSCVGDGPIPEFVDKLFCVPGVTKVTCHKYSVGITKGSVFTWDEVLPPVVEVLKNTFDLFGEVTEFPDLHYPRNSTLPLDPLDQMVIGPPAEE